MNFTVDNVQVGERFAYKVTTEAGAVVEGVEDQWTDAVAKVALTLVTVCGRAWGPTPLDSPLRRFQISG